MKICSQCKILFREQVMACPECRGELSEIGIQDALRVTEQKALQQYITGRESQKLSPDYIQYHIRCYLANRSLFLDFDIYKNRLKRSRFYPSFFIAPVNVTAFINFPWFLFNLLCSNFFHLNYTEYCPRCNSKHVKGRHHLEECEYNIEYATILDNIANGRVIMRKAVFQEHCRAKIKKGWRSAYHDLFLRPLAWEAFWDIVSISSTIFFWLYLAYFVSYPITKMTIQAMQQVEAYEWTFLTLR